MPLSAWPGLSRRHALRSLSWGALAGLGACSLPPPEAAVGAVDMPRQVPTGKNYRVAWVFSSGGPRGFVHVGVLKALHELGVQPDLVLGSSVGALVGSLYAAGMGVTQLESMALNASLGSLFRLNLRGQGWISGAGLADLVNTAVQGRRLQQLPTPFAAAAIMQQTGELVAFNWGDTGLAVQAACAVEGQLAPVRIGNQWFVDADRVSPMPVRLARRLGALRVLAVDASAFEDQAPPGAESYRAFDLRKRALTQADAAHADLVLHPEFGYYTGVSRAYRESSMAAGYRHTLQHARALQALHAA